MNKLGELTCDATQELSGEGLDVMARKGSELVVFEKVVYAHAEKLGNEANVIAMVEPVQKMNAFTG